MTGFTGPGDLSPLTDRAAGHFFLDDVVVLGGYDDLGGHRAGAVQVCPKLI